MKIFILGKICPYYEDTISKLQVSGCHITCMSDTKIASNFTYDYQKYHSLETYLSNFKNAAFDLDSGLIKSFETTEFNFICNSDRLAHTNVTIKKRRLIFRAILSYWFVELKKNKFDFILFRSTPHQLVDVIIWDLAKFFGIPCCYSERVLLTNKMFFRWDLRVLPNSDPMLNKLSINKLKIRYEKLCLPKVLTENPYTKRSKSNAHTQNLFPKGTQILKKI
ncbi:hypothetical protein OAP51_03790 [Alphaproteobacteria bacterium]|nr:hypothetical protein [Alphaproteobacteria bacterium]